MENILIINEFFLRLFDTSGFPGRWHCGTAWTHMLGWTYIGSDITICICYLIFAVIFGCLLFAKKIIPFKRFFLALAITFAACSATHFIDAMIFWVPVYRFMSLIKVINALLALWTSLEALNIIIPLFGKSAHILDIQFIDGLMSVPQPTIVTDEKGIIVGLNSYAEALFGYKVDEALGATSQFLYPKEKNEEKYLFSFQERRNPMEWETTLVRKDNINFDARIRSSTVRVGLVVKRILLIRDISAEKKYANDLSEANAALQRSNDELAVFTSLVCHDLRSPLRNVHSLVQCMDGIIQTLPICKKTEAVKVFFTKTQEQVSQMNKVLFRLLQYAQLDCMNEGTEVCQIKDIWKSAVELEVIPTGYTITFEGTEISLNTHKIKLQQVFQNLISNAIKFRDSKKPGHLKAWINDFNNHIEFHVQDDGIGIPLEYRDKVYQMFRRLDRTGQAEGSGMGLAFVKKIIQNHGGEIYHKSTVDKGTTFIFTWEKKFPL